jgi:large subunit ribosomal protein L16
MVIFDKLQNKSKKKCHQLRNKPNLYRHNLLFLKHGIFGLKAKESGWFTPKQLEAARRFLSRRLGRYCHIIFAVYPDLSITKKPREVRMGKGKGNIFIWVARVHKGTMFLEIVSPITKQHHEWLRIVKYKMPVRSTVYKFDSVEEVSELIV